MLLVDTLSKQAFRIYPSPFLDRRLYLKAFDLENLVDVYKNLPKERLKVQKELFSYYVRNKQWLKAEELAIEILPKVSRKMPIYEQLEHVYNYYKSAKLPKQLKTIADAYQESGKTFQAERIYQKLFDLEPNYERGVDLAASMAKQNKVAQAVKLYYETTGFAILGQNTQGLAQCIDAIKVIDPTFRYLTLSERIQLLTQSQYLMLSEKVQSLEEQLAANSLQLQRVTELLPPSIPKIAFGKNKWETYFGDIGVEPPLPPDIYNILTGPCPFWPGKTVHETHMLVLIPKTVNGTPLTLNTLEELIKKPKQGYPTKYDFYWDEAKKQLGDRSLPNSFWILMTKDVLTNTISKSYHDQCQVVESYSQTTKIVYEVPSTLVAATAILVEHVQTRTRLYSDQPWTFTRCQEKVAGYQMAVGGFSSSGLRVFSSVFDDYVGVSALRKF